MEIKEVYDLYEKYLGKEIIVKACVRKHRKQKKLDL